MAIQKISAGQAFELAKRNPQSRYPKPGNGQERLFPVPRPVGRPSFKLALDNKVFTLGSCFAREVDRALRGLGFQVLSREANLDAEVERAGKDESLYNKYTVHSILNEIRWALDPDAPHPGGDALLPTGGGKWCDPQLGGSTFSGTFEQMMAFRGSFVQTMQRVREADVIIITLGLVEAWFDKNSGLYLNAAPPPRAVVSEPDRFELHVLDYQEIISALEEVHALLSRFGKPGWKMLLTVSPVALLSTFRDQDVLVANMYSKSVQRAAAEAFVLRHENVDYFPSYEFVTLGDPKTNWTHDYRHVHPRVVNRIMSSVMAAYLDDPELAQKALSDDAHMLYGAQDYEALITLYAANDPKYLSSLALYRIGLAYKKVARFAEALDVFRICVQRNPDDADAQRNLAAMQERLQKQSKRTLNIREG
ncbi:MAG: GSCFA domain-containing protein [Roseinatronobacter sp.]